MIDSNNHNRLIRKVRGITAAAVVVAFIALGVPSVAFADTTYAISGTVVLEGPDGGSTAAPAGSVTVEATTSPSGTPGSAGSVDVDASGSYSLGGLAPGSYYLYFKYNGTGGYLSTWYLDAAYQSTPDSPLVITNANVAAHLMGVDQPISISGNVTLGAAGVAAGAGEVSVRYSPLLKSGVAMTESTGVLTDSTGAYTIPNLSPGRYRVHFVYVGSGPYSSAYWSDNGTTAFLADADAVITSDDPIPDLDGDMPSVASVSGSVYLGSTATPAGAGIGVTVQFLDPRQGSAGWLTAGTTTTDSTGQYSLTGLVGLIGLQTLVTYTYSGSGPYLGTCGEDLPYPLTNTVTVNDVTIPSVHTVSGHVSVGTVSRSATVGEVHVRLAGTGMTPVTLLTDASGNFSTSGIPTGDYNATFHYLGTGSYADDTVYFSVPSTGDVTNVDDTMMAPNLVSGVVFGTASGDGIPVHLPGIQVTARRFDPTTGTFLDETETVTGSNGAYSFGQLLDGAYEFDFTDPSGRYAPMTEGAAPQHFQIVDSSALALNEVLTVGASIGGNVLVVGGSAADFANGHVVATLETDDYQVGTAESVIATSTVQLSAGAYRFSFPSVNPGQYRIRVDYRGTAGNATSYLSLPAGIQSGESWGNNTISLTLTHPDSAVGTFANRSTTTGMVSEGWAVWPGSPTTSVGVALNIGSNWYPATANLQNADANNETSVAGNHGFNFTLSEPPGQYYGCVWTTEPSGPAVDLGCEWVVVPDTSRTVLWMDTLTGVAGGVHAAGFAIYPDNFAGTVGVALNIGGSWLGMTANQSTTEGQAAYPGSDPNHGFSGTMPMGPGTYNACIWATEPTGPSHIEDCVTVTVPPRPSTVAAIDAVTGSSAGVSVSGYAVYPDSLGTAVGVAVNIGSAWYSISANVANPEVPAAVAGADPNHGFASTLALPPGTYAACVWVTEPSGVAVKIGCSTVTVPSRPKSVAAIDSATGSTAGLTVAGYAVYPDSFGTAVGIALNIGSGWYGFTANSANSEVPSAVPGADPNHGFTATVPLSPGTYTACLWVAESTGPAIEVGCRTVTVPAITPAVTSFASATAVTGGIQVTGYSEFPGAPGTAVGVAANVGESWYGFTANGADVTIAGHGFTGFIAAAHGTYSVCMWTTEPSGPAVAFGCESVVVP